MDGTIVGAINQRRLLQLTYHYGTRIVEPHAYGRSKKGHEILRAYQVSGYSESGEPTGWKLFRVDEIGSIVALQSSFAPRWDYQRDDRAMDQIYAQV